MEIAMKYFDYQNSNLKIEAKIDVNLKTLKMVVRSFKQ